MRLTTVGPRLSVYYREGRFLTHAIISAGKNECVAFEREFHELMADPFRSKFRSLDF
jgi:hypothetical protein